MPLNLTIVNQTAQPITNMLIVLGSALLGAIVGGASTYLANSRIENRRMKVQAYIQLNAIKRAIGQVHFELAEARLIHMWLYVSRELGGSSDITSDDNYMRWLKQADASLANFNGFSERLLETMTLVELSFKQSPELEQRVNEVERSSDLVSGYVADINRHFEERIRDILSSRGIIITSLTDPMLNEILDEVQEYVDTNTEEPIDSLLVYLDREIKR
jgi:hypothetical protein